MQNQPDPATSPATLANLRADLDQAERTIHERDREIVRYGYDLELRNALAERRLHSMERALNQCDALLDVIDRAATMLGRYEQDVDKDEVVEEARTMLVLALARRGSEVR